LDGAEEPLVDEPADEPEPDVVPELELVFVPEL
jgi:hypothetical protein